MFSPRLLMSALFGAVILAGCAAESGPLTAMANSAANPITGEGLPNPNPTRIGSWATLPEGREWGSTAGLDIDQTDGHVWGYERCGSGSAGGPGINCDNNPVDPIVKFDRHTGEVLAQGRLRGAVDAYYASPVAADGKIYFASELGLVAVVEPGGGLDVVSVGDLDDLVYGTPAIEDSRIYLRTRNTLYCFGFQ